MEIKKSPVVAPLPDLRTTEARVVAREALHAVLALTEPAKFEIVFQFKKFTLHDFKKQRK